MNKQELKSLIREEIKKILKENYKVGDTVHVNTKAFPNFKFPSGNKGKVIDIDKADYASDELVYTVKINYIDAQGDKADTLHIEDLNQTLD